MKKKNKTKNYLFLSFGSRGILICSESGTPQCFSLPVHAGIASRLPFTLSRNKQVRKMNERKSYLQYTNKLKCMNLMWTGNTVHYNERLSHLKARATAVSTLPHFKVTRSSSCDFKRSRRNRNLLPLNCVCRQICSLKITNQLIS